MNALKKEPFRRTCSSFLKRYKESDNAEALFRQAMFEYFTLSKVESALELLKKAPKMEHQTSFDLKCKASFVSITNTSEAAARGAKNLVWVIALCQGSPMDIIMLGDQGVSTTVLAHKPSPVRYILTEGVSTTVLAHKPSPVQYILAEGVSTTVLAHKPSPVQYILTESVSTTVLAHKPSPVRYILTEGVSTTILAHKPSPVRYILTEDVPSYSTSICQSIRTLGFNAKILAMDVGMTHIGLALCPPAEEIAHYSENWPWSWYPLR
ncbi:hypothetical protein ACOSQ3_020344 [Xanthoceras sorbifolium]